MGRADEDDVIASAVTTTTSCPRCGTVARVTSETSVCPDAAPQVQDAWVAADAVAADARVRVRELHDLRELTAAAELYCAVWKTDTRTAPVSPDLLRALSHAGNYVAGAFDGTRLVAASMAFHTGSAETGLHSQISGVLPEVQSRDVGRALKLHQRAWALEHGLATIVWTYDPLLRRNAWFNLTKLGVRGVGYLVDFYGVMEDAQNGGDESDRVVAVWNLTAPAVCAAARGERTEPDLDELLGRGAHVALRAERGEPVVDDVPDGTRCVLVEIPHDVQSLRLANPALARRWREASRAVLEPLMAGAFTATGFTRSGCYVLEGISE